MIDLRSPGRRNKRLRRQDLVDLLGSFIVTTAAISALRPVFDGPTFVAASLAGAALGTALVGLGVRLRLPWPLTAALGAFVYFTVGTFVALDTPRPTVPTVDAVQRLAEAAIRGWTDVLSVLPPVGPGGDLLVVPFMLGLLTAALSAGTALRSREGWGPVAAPVLALLVCLLLGTAEPRQAGLSAVVVGLVAVVWLTLRERRNVIDSSGLARDVVAAVVVIAIAAAASVTAAEAAAGRTPGRFVLRDRFLPPFDPRAYPSPLSDYRMFVLPGDSSAPLLRDTAILKVQGLPPGSLLRWAVMDEYDGQVWTASQPGSTSGASTAKGFQRVGARIGDVDTSAGTAYAIEVLDLAANGMIWLPVAGSPGELRFTGRRGDLLQTDLRLNRDTGTAVVAGAAGGLQPADTYSGISHFPAVTYADPGEHGLDIAAARAARALDVPLPGEPAVFEAFRGPATELSGDAANPYDTAAFIAEGLRERGDLSHGAADQSPSAPGHYIARLQEMLAPDAASMTGDAEQFAAVMAAMLRSLELPARVVMGVVVADRSEVRGAEVTAWVELGLDGVGWVPFFPTPSAEREPTPRPETEDKPTPKEQPRPPTSAEVAQSVASSSSASDGVDGPEGVEPAQRRAWVVVVVWSVGAILYAVAVALLIAAAKALRTRRRRALPPAPAAAAAWQHVLDYARDGGLFVPTGATRRETAPFLPLGAATVHLARRVDAAQFSQQSPVDASVREIWHEAEAARAAIAATWPRARRLKAALNLASFRRDR